jgi:hypothetical protein
MSAVKILSDFFNKKVWSVQEFLTLSLFVALNPLIIVVVEFVFGIQFLTGVIAGWLILFAIKTKWRKDA